MTKEKNGQKVSADADELFEDQADKPAKKPKPADSDRDLDDEDLESVSGGSGAVKGA